MSLEITKPIVSVNWLNNHLNDKNLIILDCTIPKVTVKSTIKVDKVQIKGAVFFDIKNTFSDKKAPFPNTILPTDAFENKAQELGINKESIVVCYDDLGVYSSPRVWWMFQLMGFKNVAILNGGLPKWKENNYPIEKPTAKTFAKGNFKASYQPNKITFTNNILSNINNKDFLVVDARSSGRFNATEAEPRKEIKGGHIPNSVNLPFLSVLENGMFKTEEELKIIFDNLNPEKKDFIFSCGSGITASILALASILSGYKNYAVYDGSWTEWGSTENLPIEK
ncbi:sulfurtransferase [Polaribacter sargassicola]|uniref:sulfurtransferase n=1 Tax=Polaribacter sargassicola TaxID=2836891 RepID=UPI001F395AF6|nr:sulfurtransferase [Polaribacter sp. DS7-9]MCG1037635.1 sulfurtransferase [Polaribacter sp. DS7-9]